jgi:hypothetical protein
MKKILILLTIFFLISNVSSEIVINNQPESLYNLDDLLVFPIKINAIKDIQEFLSINLICPKKTTEIHREYINLKTGEEKKIYSSIHLTSNFVGDSIGNCKLKANLGEKYALSKEFSLSNKIEISLTSEKKEFNPEETLIIEGNAIKENKNPVEGFINASLINEKTLEVIEIKNTVKKGYFYIEYILPKDKKAGNYKIKINVYEKDNFEKVSNFGFAETSILVKQVPNNLEIFLEKKEIEPGKNLKLKAILHDQTGEIIESNSLITIRDNHKKIIIEKKLKINEFLEIPINYNELPNIWSAEAKSGSLIEEIEFKIIEKKDISVDLINNTLILTNKGNVPYNNTIGIKVGENITFLDIYLKVDQFKKYKINAPEGKYNILIESEGKEKFSSQGVFLTGNAIKIKETQGVIGIIRHISVWIFIIIILGFISFIVFKKGYKKSFFGYIKRNKKTTNKNEKNLKEIKKENLFGLNENKAELSLSIKGEKQNTDVICLKLKNIDELISKKNLINEKLIRIINESKEHKAYIYENSGNIFFILSPILTKTFKNERTTLELAEKIRKILEQHNHFFKQKINYGISIDTGEIIINFNKKDKIMKFMCVGKLMQELKKIANLSEGEILLNEKFKVKLGSEFKIEKKKIQEKDVYIIKEIVNKTEHKKFIDSFLKRIED